MKYQTKSVSRWIAAALIAFAIACLPSAAWADDGENLYASSTPQATENEGAALTADSEDGESGRLDEGLPNLEAADSESTDHGNSQDSDAENELDDDADKPDDSETESSNEPDDKAADGSGSADTPTETIVSGGEDVSNPSLIESAAALGEPGDLGETTGSRRRGTSQHPEAKTIPPDEDDSPESNDSENAHPSRSAVQIAEKPEAAAPQNAAIPIPAQSGWHATEVGQSAASLDSTSSWNRPAHEDALPAVTPAKRPSSHSGAAGSNSNRTPFALPEEASQRIAKNVQNSEIYALLSGDEPCAPTRSYCKAHVSDEENATTGPQNPTRCRSPSHA